MKKLVLLGLVGLLFFPLFAHAQPYGVKLGWTYQQGPTAAVGFRVYRQDVCIGAFTKLAEVPLQTQTYSDMSLQAGTKYCFRVTAVDATGKESAPSTVLTFQVPQASQPPATPDGLSGTLILP